MLAPLLYQRAAFLEKLLIGVFQLSVFNFQRWEKDWK